MQQNKASARVLITGGGGFIGHHLVEHFLRNSDFEIVVLDRLDTSGDPDRLTDLECWEAEKQRVTFRHWDLKAPFSDQKIKQLGEFDYIFHLAAGTHVDRSIADPYEFAMDNVIGTVNILEFARKKLFSWGKFFYFSTDEVFGPAPEGVAYNEWDRYHSGNPYAAAKAGGEEMALAYHNTYGLPVIITHTMNVFGERQHPEKFIPMTIRKVLRGETIEIHSDPSKTKPASRMWIHARNVASALTYLMGMEGMPGEKYNIVGEREVNVEDMAVLIADIVSGLKHEEYDAKIEKLDFHSSRPGHDMRYALSGAKMKAIGWEPPKTFEQSLRKTVDWYIKNPQWL